MKPIFLHCAVALALISLPASAWSQDTARSPTSAQHQDASRQDSPHAKSDRGGGVLDLLPADAVSDHTLDLDGRQLGYTATAGTLNLYDPSGRRSAAVFYTSYVAKDQSTDRPITFVFNGGQTCRQPAKLARLHRPRADRSYRHRLEPHREGG